MIERLDQWLEKYLNPLFIVVFGTLFGSYGMQSRGEKSSMVALIALIIGLFLLLVGFIWGIILYFKKRTRSA